MEPGHELLPFDDRRADVPDQDGVLHRSTVPEVELHALGYAVSVREIVQPADGAARRAPRSSPAARARAVSHETCWVLA